MNVINKNVYAFNLSFLEPIVLDKVIFIIFLFIIFLHF
jgi:hypothetical protein